MSLPDVAAKLLKLLVILGIVAALGGCSGFRPVHGEDGADTANYSFYYPDPGNRLDQIIYTELRLRLGPASAQDGAYSVSVATSTSSRGLTRTSVTKPATTSEMVVTTSIVVSDPEGKIVFSGRRSASALYTTAGQVLADVEAATEASERGAKALADIVRLSVLGALSQR